MKINWGTGIAIFYSLFVIAMVSMVIKSTHHKADLVQEDYYNRDINYEEFRVKRQNAEQIAVKIDVQSESQDRFIHIVFPEDFAKAKGEITLFRPSDKYRDSQFNLKLDGQGSMKIPLDRSILPGLWKIMLDWELEEKPYFIEEHIVL